MFKLNQKTRASIAKSTGLSFDQILSMDAEEVDSHIEKKIGKKLNPSYRKGSSFVNRGSVYMFLQRLVSRETVDKKLAKI